VTIVPWIFAVAGMMAVMEMTFAPTAKQHLFIEFPSAMPLGGLTEPSNCLVNSRISQFAAPGSPASSRAVGRILTVRRDFVSEHTEMLGGSPSLSAMPKMDGLARRIQRKVHALPCQKHLARKPARVTNDTSTDWMV
jgi:hypothetical protein